MKKIRRFFRSAEYRRTLIIAALVIVMAIAAVFIYVNGESETITLQSSAQTRPEAASGESEVKKGIVYVDVGGCVKDPGVYELEEGCRIFEAIEMAGGFTRDADTALINQAEVLTDGMKIMVPDKNSNEESRGENAVSEAGGESLININTADSESLQTIPGIGPVTAGSIIRMREEAGAFKSIEDIKNVSGIGDKTFEKIRPYITV